MLSCLCPVSYRSKQQTGRRRVNCDKGEEADRSEVRIARPRRLDSGVEQPRDLNSAKEDKACERLPRRGCESVGYASESGVQLTEKHGYNASTVPRYHQDVNKRPKALLDNNPSRDEIACCAATGHSCLTACGLTCRLVALYQVQIRQSRPREDVESTRRKTGTLAGKKKDVRH